ncbi:VWA domain-containing protein [Paracidovorax wautersii]|uniref:Magnesium chelatase subunit ChlD-like protein n=1 Tax=Paracidovorax wautersii TaxID=1177982 RepID=A0ABU1IDB9_9BURK|nr:VWA domain-containing protein [Paracidovorax wautersii]MDR6214568.1 magnesium chelatase subunit ChlD-like protein [Paracidovorax wautersii]
MASRRGDRGATPQRSTGAPPGLAAHGGGDARAAGAGSWDWPRTLAARGAGPLRVQHLRRRPAPARDGRLHCFVLDCSASMAASGALARAKGVLLALMDEAYRQRDHVALVCFAGTQVEVRLPPRKAGAWNDGWIAPIAGGGGTPLAGGVEAAGRLLERAGSGPAQAWEGWLWLLTDGRTREQPPRPGSAQEACIIDFDTGRIALHRARGLAERWQARYLPAAAWSADTGSKTGA